MVIEPVGENAAIPTSEPPTPSSEPKQAPTPEPPVPPAPPVAQTPEPVPTTPATYTLDELQRAAVGLMDKGMSSTDLVAMLGEFGVQAITEVPADQFGAFAMKLRENGKSVRKNEHGSITRRAWISQKTIKNQKLIEKLLQTL